MRQSLQWWLAWACMMFFGWAIRLLALDALPLFIDETVLVQWTTSVLRGDPLAFGSDGRYLTPWVTAFFVPQNASVWVVRLVSLLWVMISWATLVALARRFGGRRAALWSLSLVIFAPALSWHERLALADHALSALLLVWLWLMLRAWELPRFQPMLHALSGLAFVLAFLAKSSALLLLPLPLCLAVILGRWPWRMRWQGLIWHYGVILGLSLPFVAFLRWRGVDFLGRATQGTADSLLDFGRFAEQTAFFVEHWLSYLPWTLSLTAWCCSFWPGAWMSSAWRP